MGVFGIINLAFEQLTGYSREELRSIDWAKILTPPEWREIEQKKLEELHSTGQPVRYEKEYVRKDGTRVPIRVIWSTSSMMQMKNPSNTIPS